MACLFGHKWNSCKCSKCGKTRDEQHDFDLCKGKCKHCGKTQAEQHSWNGCKCSRCGKTRDEQHDWNGCICSRCGKRRNDKHSWNGCKCSSCGFVREEGHKWVNCKCTTCGREITPKDIEKMTDQSLLCEIAKNTDSPALGVAVAKKLSDDNLAQTIFSNVALNDKVSDGLRVEAIKMLTDQIVLADIAQGNSFGTLRKVAIERLTDQSILSNIVNGETKNFVCSWQETVNEGNDYWSSAKEHTLDLRDIARKRLVELQKNG